MDNIFKLYIDKNNKNIIITRNNSIFYTFNYYKDTINRKIPHVLHKALSERIIIPGVAFNLYQVYNQCKKYFININNSFIDLIEKSTYPSHVYDPDFIMIYDILYCNIIVNNKYILPAIFTKATDSISTLEFTVIMEDLDRYVAETKYGIIFPKYFRMDLCLINKIWYEKIFS